MIPNKLQVKVFATGLDAERVSDAIPVFHRWITERALEEILVDVADYRHVFQGPGITLIGHESTYALDEQGGRWGLVCFRKRGFHSEAYEPLLDALRRALAACARLERDLGVEGKLFDAGALKVSLADRTMMDSRFEITEFADRVATQLARLYQSDPDIEITSDGSLPAVDLRWSTPRCVAGIL